MKKSYANLLACGLACLVLAGCTGKPPVGDEDEKYGTRQIGDPCDNAHKCMGGLFCEDGICRVLCNKKEDCASGEECQNNRCVKTNKQEATKNKQKGESCDAMNGCIDGLVCEGGKCMVPCKDKSACGANEECQNGVCVPQSGPAVPEVKVPELTATAGNATDASGAAIQVKGQVITGTTADQHNNSIEINTGYWTKQ